MTSQLSKFMGYFEKKKTEYLKKGICIKDYIFTFSILTALINRKNLFSNVFGKIKREDWLQLGQHKK